jgi:hypothetical protein
MSTVRDAANLALEEAITLEEIYDSIKTGKQHKAPGYGGICLTLKKTWETIKDDLLQIVNEMYNSELITDQHKYGIIVHRRDPIPLMLKTTDP